MLYVSFVVEITTTLGVKYGHPTRKGMIPVEGGHEIRVTDVIILLLE